MSERQGLIRRVTFRGVFPRLLPSGNDRHTYTRLFESREDAEEIFRAEPTAYRVDRWEPETKDWVMLEIRDRT